MPCLHLQLKRFLELAMPRNKQKAKQLSSFRRAVYTVIQKFTLNAKS